MTETFKCRYCGKEKQLNERNYDVGLYLAQQASLVALMHCNGVQAYRICTQCADEIMKDEGDDVD